MNDKRTSTVRRAASCTAPASSQEAGTLGLRLNKRMADLGLCSRREADAWIEQGWVWVNGQAATVGQKVLPSDDISVKQGAKAQQARHVTILLHKPVGYVSSQAEEGYQNAAALVTAQNHWSGDTSRIRFRPEHTRGLAAAGRLDIESTGLLVLTQDGRVVRSIIGEDVEIEKEYLVRVSYRGQAQNVRALFPPTLLAKLRHGLSLDGKALKPAKVEWQNPEQLRFILTEGKKRQIRRMCELVGLRVTGLKRVRIGQLMLGKLPMGKWRYMADNERV